MIKVIVSAAIIFSISSISKAQGTDPRPTPPPPKVSAAEFCKGTGEYNYNSFSSNFYFDVGKVVEKQIKESCKYPDAKMGSNILGDVLTACTNECEKEINTKHLKNPSEWPKVKKDEFQKCGGECRHISMEMWAYMYGYDGARKDCNGGSDSTHTSNAKQVK